MGVQFFPFGLFESKQIAACILLQVTIVPLMGLLVASRLRAIHRYAVLTNTMLVLLACPLLVMAFHGSGIRLPITVATLSSDSLTRAASELSSPLDTAVPNLPGVPDQSPAITPSTATVTQVESELLGEIQATPNNQMSSTPAVLSVKPSSNATARMDQSTFRRGQELHWFEWAVWLWSIGAIVGTTRLLMGSVVLGRLLRTATEMPVPAQLENSIRSSVFKSRPLRLFESSRVQVPIVAGLRRPMIIMPAGVHEELTEEELSAIVAHEYAHAQRGDCLVGVLQRITAILYWFHPVVHWLNRRIAITREEICDNYALLVTEPTTYARLLLKLGEKQPPQLRMAMPLVSSQWKLEDRIKGLLDAKRDRGTRANRAGWATSLAALAFALFASSAQLVATPNDDKPASSSSSETSGDQIPKDFYGDPIPFGGEVRLGTSRLRPVGDGWHRKIAFTKDGLIFTLTMDGKLDWWDPKTGKKVRSLDIDVGIRGFAIAPDRSTFTVAFFKYYEDKPETDYGIAIRNLNTGELVKTITHERTHDDTHIFYTPDGKNLLSVDTSIEGACNAHVFDIVLGEELLTYKIPLERRRLEAAASSPDGKQIAIAGNQRVWLWNWSEGSDPEELKGLGDVHLYAMQYSPDGKYLLLGHDHGKVGLDVVDLEIGEVVRKFRDPNMELMRFDNVEFANNGKLLIVPNEGNMGAGSKNGICVWDFETGELVNYLHDENSAPGMVALSPDQKILATACDGEVAVWDWKDGKRFADEFVAHAASVTGVRFLPGTNHMVTSSDDQSVRLWNATTGEYLQSSNHDHWVRGMDVSPDGKWIASSALGDTVRLLDAKTLKTVYELPGHGSHGGTRCVSFTPDSKRFASFGDEPFLRVWDVTTGKAVLEEEIKPGGEPLKSNSRFDDFIRLSCGLSHDASRLVVIKNGQTYVFDATNGKEIAHIESAKPIEAATFGPDTEHLLIQRPYVDATETPLPDGRVRHRSADKFEAALLHIESGEVKWSFKMDGRSGPARMAPNGKIAVVSMRDSKSSNDMVYVLDADSGEQLCEIEVGKLAWDSAGANVGISEDGRLAMPMRDSSVIVWDLKKLGGWK